MQIQAVKSESDTKSLQQLEADFVDNLSQPCEFEALMSKYYEAYLKCMQSPGGLVNEDPAAAREVKLIKLLCRDVAMKIYRDKGTRKGKPEDWIQVSVEVILSHYPDNTFRDIELTPEKVLLPFSSALRINTAVQRNGTYWMEYRLKTRLANLPKLEANYNSFKALTAKRLEHSQAINALVVQSQATDLCCLAATAKVHSTAFACSVAKLAHYTAERELATILKEVKVSVKSNNPFLSELELSVSFDKFNKYTTSTLTASD
jgi:hypothetical protein